MRINFDKLKKIELEYENSPVSLNALQSMMNIVLHVNDATSKYAMNHNIAINTLINLGIIEYNKNSSVQQLNS